MYINGYKDLADAIIVQDIKVWKSAMKKLEKDKLNIEARKVINEMDVQLNNSQLQTLTDDVRRLELPQGKYVLQILYIKVSTSQHNGYELNIFYDIEEGPYKNFYLKDYQAQVTEKKSWNGKYSIELSPNDWMAGNKWSQKALDNFIISVEKSNYGYHFDWDEGKIKGMLVGGIFVLQEHINAQGVMSSMAKLYSFCNLESLECEEELTEGYPFILPYMKETLDINIDENDEIEMFYESSII